MGGGTGEHGMGSEGYGAAIGFWGRAELREEETLERFTWWRERRR
jgi:hypothetical protein